MLPADLVTRWRTMATTLEPYAPEAAKAFANAADELAVALHDLADQPVTPAEAEAEGICSAEAVRKAVREGRAENLGTETRVQVRRKDLPKGRGGASARKPSSFGRVALAVADSKNQRRG